MQIEDIEEQMKTLMAIEKPVDRDQGFFNLLKKVGLPIDSSDVHERKLTYPEMHERLSSYLEKKKQERRENKLVCATRCAAIAAMISAICALVSVLVALFVKYCLR